MGKMKFNKSGTRIFSSVATIEGLVKKGKISPGLVARKVPGGYIPVRKPKK